MGVSACRGWLASTALAASLTSGAIAAGGPVVRSTKLMWPTKNGRATCRYG